jgi:hypothetical protein
MLEPTAIAGLRDDKMVRLVGRARPLAPLLTAPMSGEPCLCFLTITDEGPPGLGMWREFGREQRGIDFVLDDGTGQALIRAAGAQLGGRRPGDTIGAWLEGLLRRMTFRLFMGGRMRWREWVITADHPVAVGGMASFELDARAEPTDYREAPHKVVFAAADDVPLYIANVKR